MSALSQPSSRHSYNANLNNFFGPSYNEGTLKVAKDIVLFLVDGCNLDKGTIAEFLAQ
jgi:hypothetical protein